MSLNFCYDIQMVGSTFGVYNMKAWIYLVLFYRSGCFWWCNGVRIISLAHFGPSIPTEHCLNASIVPDHVHPFTLCDLVMPTSSRITCHATKLKLSQTGFLNMTGSSLHSNYLQISIQYHLWDVVEREIRVMHPANLKQLSNAMMSIWTKISKDCFQHIAVCCATKN